MDFISLSLNHWGDLWQSRHQITSELARYHKVLFVCPPFSYGDVVSAKTRRTLPKSGVVHRGKNLYTVVYPKWLMEAPGHALVGGVLARLRSRYVRGIADRLGFKDIVVIIWHPQFVDAAKSFREKLTCYYVDDEFGSYTGMTDAQRQQVYEREDRLLRVADLVFANGPALLEDKNRYGNAISVPMTADYELFSKSRLSETAVPADLASVPHPRLGYIGNLNDKVDFQLLRALAEARPACSFVLVGPVNIRTAETRRDFEALKSCTNVYFLGLKDRDSLPGCIRGLDVCLMSYRTDGWARHIYPLKIHEYLASGKPIVGSPLRSIQEFDGPVRLAGSVEQWIQQIDAALADDDPVMAGERVQIAYENRLEERIRVIRQAVKEALDKKGRH